MAQKFISNSKEVQRKSRRHLVRQIRPNWYKVKSDESGRVYDVALGLNGGTCTCEWGRQRPDEDHRSACSHVIAAMNSRAIQRGRRVSAWRTVDEARRQHRPMLPIGDGIILTSRLKN